MEPTLQIAATVRQECYWLEARNKLVESINEGENSIHPTAFSVNSIASRANSQVINLSLLVYISEKCFYY